GDVFTSVGGDDYLHVLLYKLLEAGDGDSKFVVARRHRNDVIAGIGSAALVDNTGIYVPGVDLGAWNNGAGRIGNGSCNGSLVGLRKGAAHHQCDESDCQF